MSQSEKRWVKFLVAMWCLVLIGLVAVVFVLTLKLSQIERLLNHTISQQVVLLQMNKKAFTSIEELQYKVNNMPPSKPDNIDKNTEIAPPKPTPPNTPRAISFMMPPPSRSILQPKASTAPPPPSSNTPATTYPQDDIPEVCTTNRCSSTHGP